jgi:hypothetical protein
MGGPDDQPDDLTHRRPQDSSGAITLAIDETERR